MRSEHQEVQAEPTVMWMNTSCGCIRLQGMGFDVPIPKQQTLLV